MYDIIIIGAGPAGISASLYAKRANLHVLVLYFGESNLEKAHQIDNYYGFENGISGKDLYEKGIKQAENIGVETKNEEVLDIEKEDESFFVTTVNGKYEGQAVIIATSNKKLRPDIKGVQEYEGKGISYCAICDGFFYRNKNIAVIGNGKFALKEAETLKNITGNITILTDGLEMESQNEFNVINTKIIEIKGNEKVEQVEFEDGTSLEIDGIFIALGEAGGADFARKIGVFTNKDNIAVDNNMETNVKGLFACGNVTGGLLQVSKAVYEGATAGLSAVNHIKQIKKEN